MISVMMQKSNVRSMVRRLQGDVLLQVIQSLMQVMIVHSVTVLVLSSLILHARSFGHTGTLPRISS